MLLLSSKHIGMVFILVRKYLKIKSFQKTPWGQERDMFTQNRKRSHINVQYLSYLISKYLSYLPEQCFSWVSRKTKIPNCIIFFSGTSNGGDSLGCTFSTNVSFCANYYYYDYYDYYLLREKCPNMDFFSGMYFLAFGQNTEIYFGDTFFTQ